MSSDYITWLPKRRGSQLHFWLSKMSLICGYTYIMESSIHRVVSDGWKSLSVFESSQLNMFVLETHCFLFSILCSFFLPCKHFSLSAQELIKPPSKHSTDVKVKNSQAIHNKPSAENHLSKLFGENLRSNENTQRYLGRF